MLCCSLQQLLCFNVPRKAPSASHGAQSEIISTRAILEGTTTAKGQAVPTGEGTQSQPAAFRAAADSTVICVVNNNIAEAISW